jgi:hypothetical protein
MSASFFEALQTFAATVHDKMSQLVMGEPEDQLRGPFENFMAEVAEVLGWNIVCTGETPIQRLGRPDYAVLLNKLLSGYVELKAPGIGADPKNFKGHNREQWKRFKAIPNLLYCDGNEWALYRSGELVDRLVRLTGDIAGEGEKAATAGDAGAVERLLRNFLSWQPIIPFDRKGKIDLHGFAALIAPLCRMLRDDVTEALQNPSSPLVKLARDWRQLLFPNASDEEFSDAYAQTVTFALLLGRSEKADPLTLESAEAALAAHHSLLARALQVLTDPAARADMAASLDLILRILTVVPPESLSGPENPWLYFYEEFLAAYDPNLRKDVGAYYTPVEVVRAQVRLIDDLLVNRLEKPMGFADEGVITLDPAAGTGTYLLGVIEHALNRIREEQGEGAVAGKATALAKNLYGFEILAGPFAVTELRVSRALHDRGAALPDDGIHVYLTDTLESPHAVPPELPLYLKPISDQHAKALELKSRQQVIVCLGNPPYDRHEAATVDNKARTGGWVRWGDGKDNSGHRPIFSDFLDPAVAAGHGVHLKNLYNLYVYFWRWALWKVFEHDTAKGPGIVSFISASSYLEGDAFSGMREHMRRVCDEIWILDLGGEGRGTRKTDNVFSILTPVAVAVAVRSRKPGKNKKPAKVHYVRIEGDRKTKLARLDKIKTFRSIKWQDCETDWQALFRPNGKGKYFDWPLLIDLIPWQHSGGEIKRTWPIGHDPETLKARWRALLAAPDRATAFKETRDRQIDSKCSALLAKEELKPLDQLTRNALPPPLKRYAYRSFDRQWIFPDPRLGDYLRPDLWRAFGPKQVFITSLFNHPLGSGPALTACSNIPDRHHLRGSFSGKDVLPLFRNTELDPNLLPGLLDLLGETFKRKVLPEDFLAYVYGALAQPDFTARFSKELETRELRVPLTRDPALFAKVSKMGARLLWLHTYGERYVPKGNKRGVIPPGKAKCKKAVPGDPAGYPESFDYHAATRTLRVGEGEFAPVSPEVFAFEVSGLKVVQSWLKYRMKKGAGKKSSPLDDIRPERWTGQFTTELLELVWVLEATVAGYPEQAGLLEKIISGPCFTADELPPVPPEARKPPRTAKDEGPLMEQMENGGDHDGD